MLTIKLRSEKKGAHVYDTLFMGQKDQTLQYTGQIVFSSVPEWSLFGAVLLLGADAIKQKRTGQGVESDVEVVLEGWSPDDDEEKRPRMNNDPDCPIIDHLREDIPS